MFWWRAEQRELQWCACGRTVAQSLAWKARGSAWRTKSSWLSIWNNSRGFKRPKRPSMSPSGTNLKGIGKSCSSIWSSTQNSPSPSMKSFHSGSHPWVRKLGHSADSSPWTRTETHRESETVFLICLRVVDRRLDHEPSDPSYLHREMASLEILACTQVIRICRLSLQPVEDSTVGDVLAPTRTVWINHSKWWWERLNSHPQTPTGLKPAWATLHLNWNHGPNSQPQALISCLQTLNWSISRHLQASRMVGHHLGGTLASANSSKYPWALARNRARRSWTSLIHSCLMPWICRLKKLLTSIKP